MSPSLSTSAFLQSIMPAPVVSRRSFTKAAVISAISSSEFLKSEALLFLKKKKQKDFFYAGSWALAQPTPMT
jgi:hypothetical protein